MRTLNLLSPYIDSIRGFDKITKVEEFINIRFGFESKQYERLNEIDITHKIKFEHITDKKNLHTHIEKYLMPETIKLINIEPPLTLNVGHWFLNDRTEAFFIHMFVNENIYDYDYDNINSIIFLEQVASTRLFYKLCILSAFNTLLKHNHIDHIFSFIKTKFILKQALALGGKVITSINNRSAPPPNNEALLKHTIIVKIDIIKLLSNKDFLFFCLQSRVELEANN